MLVDCFAMLIDIVFVDLDLMVKQASAFVGVVKSGCHKVDDHVSVGTSDFFDDFSAMFENRLADLL